MVQIITGAKWMQITRIAWETSSIVGKQKEFLKMDNYTYTWIYKKQTTNLVQSGDVNFFFWKSVFENGFL